MSVLVVLLTLILLASVIAVISAPLRTQSTDADGNRSASQTDRGPDRTSESMQQRVELEAAREAKYREIRDLELDYRTGKLSPEDYEATNGTLRAEAVEVLDRLQALQRDEAKPKVS